MQSSGDSQMSKAFTPIEAALNSVQAEICDILYTVGARIDCTGVDCTNIISNDWFFVQIYSAQRLVHSYKYIQQRLVCCTNIFSKGWFVAQIYSAKAGLLHKYIQQRLVHCTNTCIFSNRK